MKTLRILVIDDDQYFRLGLKSALSQFGLIEEAATESQAIEMLKSNFYDLAIIDMQIDEDDSGLRILKQGRKAGIHSIIMSSVTDEHIIEQAYEYGCDHFLGKLHYKESLGTYVKKFIRNRDGANIEKFLNSEYITNNAELINQLQNLSQINLKEKSIFISGETGVGKSQLAKIIHKLTYDEGSPFIHLNCSEIPENLIESELFGHQKGAFTGAESKKDGKLFLANGGTLFLDEIATMPTIMQQKLLKAIDEKTFYPLGSTKPVQTKFTLITATCEDLFEKVSSGAFRKDLFFRINGLNLEIKPLRERKDDIELLIKYFIKESSRRFVIKADAMETLKNYSWPGNIRELKKTVELLSLKTVGIINNSELPDFIFSDDSSNSDELLTSNQKNFIAKNGLREFIKELEKQVIKDTIAKYQGKITYAIKELKISTSAFYRIFDNIK